MSDRAYRPPKSYWKEVDRLDTKIAERSAVSAQGRAFGIFSVKKHVSVWFGTDRQERAGTCWISHQAQHVGSVSTVYLGELAQVNPLPPVSEADVSPVSLGSTGLYARTLTYWAHTPGWVRRMKENFGYLPDIDGAASGQVSAVQTDGNKESQQLDEQFGLLHPGQEAYDTLLAELRRGATEAQPLRKPPC